MGFGEGLVAGLGLEPSYPVHETGETNLTSHPHQSRRRSSGFAANGISF